MDDTLRTRSTISNIPSVKIEGSISPDSETPDPESKSEENETHVASPSPQMPHPPPKKKTEVAATAQDDNVNEVIGYLKSKPAKNQFDGIDHLFLSYADTFRKFQARTQALLKMELTT